MISVQQNTECLTRLGMLKFFPVKESTVAEIGRFLNELCRSDHEARQLTGAVLARFSEWPGPSKIREIHSLEIASQRPQEVEPAGCNKCRGQGGWRPVFQVTEQLADGSIKREMVYPSGDIMLAEREIENRYAGSKTHSVDTAVVAPCDCPRGMLRRDELRQRDAQRQRQ